MAIAAGALVVGAVFGQPGTGRADTSGAPTSTTAPTISGTAQEGQTLTTDNGTWGGSPTSFAYAWNRCDKGGGSCAAIGGATAATYKPATADIGHTLTVTVSATNASGSGQATSSPTAVVSSAEAPTPTGAPVVTGTVAIGSTLSVDNGSWSGSPTSYTYAWDRCDANGHACSEISGATDNAYTLTAADAGTTLRASVVATNAFGSTETTSAATAVVPAATGCPAGTGAIQIADLAPPARLMISHATVAANPVPRRTHSIRLTVEVTACDGRPVQGAAVSATPIPYDQFATAQGTTGAAGTISLMETRASFPARPGQELLAVLVHATKPGDPSLAGVSTRRVFGFQIAAH